MKRINLVIDDRLYKKIREKAAEDKIAESALISSILKKHFLHVSGTDYANVTDNICSRISELPAGTKFTLSTFMDNHMINVMSVESMTTSQSIKSRLGKLLKKALEEGKAGSVVLTGKKIRGGHQYIKL